MSETQTHDPVNHPTHYTSHPSGIECLRITRLLNFDIGNAVKYVWRAELKDGIQAFEKAEFYLDDYLTNRTTEKFETPEKARALLQEVIIAEPNEFKRRFFSYVRSSDFARAANHLSDYLMKLRDQAAEDQQNAEMYREALFEKYPALKVWKTDAAYEELAKYVRDTFLKPSEATDPNGTVLFTDATAEEKEPERPSGAHPVMFNGKPTSHFIGWCAACQDFVRPQAFGSMKPQMWQGKDAEHDAEKAVIKHIAAEHPFEG